MRLPSLPYTDGIKKSAQIQFGGLNHIYGSKDGDLWDMRNLTSNHLPLLASRPPRMKYKKLHQGNGLYSWEKLAWVDGDGFYYDGVLKGNVTPGEKEFTSLGAYIIILPDKAYYNTFNDTFGSIESTWSGNTLTFTNGKLFEEESEANTIHVDGVDWSQYFKAGDAITIEGCTIHPENNKTPVIREIDGDNMYFYEYTFLLDGDALTTPYTETGELFIKRTVPDIKFMCENENRLWGCDDTTIYASKLGDIFNWNVYEGLGTDSYAVDTGSQGYFTGCISYLGYPIFFKEDNIYKVYGSMPSNYEVMGAATLGVAEGSHRSLAIAGELLFYLSRSGIMAYSGGIPSPVGGAFGTERFKDAVGGSDGLKYYVSMTGNDNKRLLYVYDVQSGTWMIEDETDMRYFTKYDGNLYYLSNNGEIVITGIITDPPEADMEPQVEWMAEFGDFTENDPNKKGIAKLQLRAELEPFSHLFVWMKFDSQGEWINTGQLINEDTKRSYYLPITPRRADHFKIKFTGIGACRIYSLTREYYSGSELRSTRGRN